MRQPCDMGRTIEILVFVDIGLVCLPELLCPFIHISIYFTSGCPLRSENPCGFHCWLSQVFLDPRLKDTLRVEILFLPFWLQSVKCILKYLLNNMNFIVFLCKMFKTLQSS